MRKLNILKTTLDLLMILAIIGTIGIIVGIILKTNHLKIDWNMNHLRVNSEEKSPLSNENKIHSYLESIRILIYVYCVYLFRKVTILFQKRDTFNNEVAKSFNLIGKLILISPFITSLYNCISNIIEFISDSIKYHQAKLSLSFDWDFDLFGDSFIITISTGFFFLVLSEVFKIAKGLKEENELTV